MKSLFDRHALYALFVDIQNNLQPSVRTNISAGIGVSDGILASTRPLSQAVLHCPAAEALRHL